MTGHRENFPCNVVGGTRNLKCISNIHLKSHNSCISVTDFVSEMKGIDVWRKSSKS